MKYVRFALASLVAASCLPAASGGEPYYGAAVGGYAGTGYAAGCDNCGPGYGYGMPGCCDRPVSNALHLWDGYCEEKAQGWGLNHCDDCDNQCSSCSGGWLFSLKRRHGSCTTCNSCTTSGKCSSCTSGGQHLAPVHHGHPAVDASGQAPPAPPQPPTTGRVKARRVL